MTTWGSSWATGKNIWSICSAPKHHRWTDSVAHAFLVQPLGDAWNAWEHQRSVPIAAENNIPLFPCTEYRGGQVNFSRQLGWGRSGWLSISVTVGNHVLKAGQVSWNRSGTVAAMTAVMMKTTKMKSTFMISRTSPWKQVNWTRMAIAWWSSWTNLEFTIYQWTGANVKGVRNETCNCWPWASFLPHSRNSILFSHLPCWTTSCLKIWNARHLHITTWVSLQEWQAQNSHIAQWSVRFHCRLYIVLIWDPRTGTKNYWESADSGETSKTGNHSDSATTIVNRA